MNPQMTKLINMFMISMLLIILLIMTMNMNNKYIHPMIMGIFLFMLTLMLSLNLSIYMKTHWFSFLMFLILIGGMMILFLYFVSFNNNMKMTVKWTFIMMNPIKMMMFTLMMFTIYMNLYKLMWINNNEEINLFFNDKLKFNLTFMYLEKKNLTSLMSMMYLLLTLSLIVKMCLNKKFKLRKIN